MSINVSSEEIKVKVPFSKINTSNKVETEIIVPDIKPDITRLIMSACDVENVEHQIIEHSLEVKGDLIHQIIYANNEDDQLVRSLKNRQPFSFNIPLEGAVNNCSPLIKVDAINVDNRPINPRKIHSNVEVAISGIVNEIKEIEAINDLESIESVEQIKKMIEYNKYLGKISTKLNVIDSINLSENKPSIWEVLYYNVSKIELNMDRTGGVAEVTGHANVVVMYLPENDEDQIQVIEAKIPVEGTVRLEDLMDAEILDMSYNLVGVQIEGIEDENGQIKRLSIEMEIDVSADGYIQEEIEVVEDAFMPNNELILEGEEIVKQNEILSDKGAFVIDQIIMTEEPLPAINMIIWGKAKVKKAQLINVDSEWRISGVADVKIVYLSEENEIRGINVEVPFVKNIDAPPSDFYDAQLVVEIKNLSLTLMSPREIKALLEMIYEIKYVDNKNFGVHTNYEKTECAPKVEKDEIIVYTVKEEDTLWSIAKHFLVSKENILNTDGQSPEESLTKGQRLFIMNV